MRLILASASPARLKTLRCAGLRPEVMVSGVDESAYDDLGAAERAHTLATAKARAVVGRLVEEPTTVPLEPMERPLVVIGCDSLLALDGDTFGKPGDAVHAVDRWHRMRGRSGTLLTGHCVIDATGAREVAEVARTTVHFAEVTDAEIDAYVATGEPLQVAGAFTIDGLGGAFISGVEGDPHNVVGISLPLLRSLLGQLGYTWTDLWSGTSRSRRSASTGLA